MWRSLAIDDVLRRCVAEPSGLSGAEAARRLAAFGPNRLPEVRSRGPFLRFLANFHNVLIYVLLGAAVVTAALQHWVDTGVILAVVLANAVIGFIQEGKAEAAMAAIRQMLAPHAAVLRDGRRMSVDGADLVTGDIVLLESGDKVPADLRVIEARGLAAQIEAFVAHYNHRRCHESLRNLTPADVYFGRGQTILLERERIKRQTIQQRRLIHQQLAA